MVFHKIFSSIAMLVLTLSTYTCRYQLERLGYFCIDLDSRPGKLVMNRTCTLRESFPKFASGTSR